MAKRAPRLQFTEEERASPELASAVQKADKRIKKLEKAEAKIPKKEVKQRVVDSDGKITTRLSFEEKKPPSKLSHAAKVSGDTVLHGVHRKVQQSNDGDNAGVDAANTLTEDAESAYQVGREIHHAHELKPYRKAHRAEKRADKANVKALNQEFEQQNGGFSSNPYSRWQQKRAIKREYAAAKAGRGTANTVKASEVTKKAAEKSAEAGKKAGELVAKHKKGFPGFDAGSERMKNKPEAESLQKACGSQMAVVKAVERRDKSEKPPALYDLTTLQRDANRILGFTAQQTLDYLQSLYEKKLCTYPRTDSRYLTSDMADGLPALVSNVAAAMPKVGGIPLHVNAAQVINDKKVSDHHAVIPTANFKEAALTGLPAGERAVLELVALRLLCAVSQPHEYTETAVTLECAGHSFSAKGRTVMNPGWRGLIEAYHSGEGENESADAAKALPPVDEGQTFTVHSAAVKEGKTTPPKHYTEDTLLSAMEVAGAKEMPEDAERKGLGTPATRAAILEKLVATGFVERKKSKKTVSLIPTHAGISLITVLPEQLQSPLMTAEWEHRLKEIERGEESPETFMQGIRGMVCELVKTYKTVLGADVLFPSGRAVVGKCPRCGSDVTESKKGYFCERNDCHFGLWRDNRFLAAKKINLTKKMAETLLKDGKTYASGIFSEKTGKTYDAYIVLEDDGTKTAYRLEFERGKANGKQYS